MPVGATDFSMIYLTAFFDIFSDIFYVNVVLTTFRKYSFTHSVSKSVIHLFHSFIHSLNDFLNKWLLESGFIQDYEKVKEKKTTSQGDSILMKAIAFLILAWHTGKLEVTVRGLCGLQWILLCVTDNVFFSFFHFLLLF